MIAKFQQDFACPKPALLVNAPPLLRPWLLDKHSLTQRLKYICPDSFKIEVLNQYWSIPLLSESLRLKISHKQRVFTREVLLYCAGQAVVFARTVIPMRTLKGRLSCLTMLGDTPLGEVLFAPHIKRSSLEVTPLRPGYLYNTVMNLAANDSAATIWARRSTFTYHKKSLLVSEIFLPNAKFGYG